MCTIVINLTDLTFTDEDIDLINMRLSSSPSSTKHSVADMWLDYQRFERTLILKHKFHNSQPMEKDPLYSFKENSTWKPYPGPIEIQQLTRSFKQELLTFLDKKPKFSKNNITKKQKELIQTLRKNKKITIKKADKGAAVVILMTSDYLREAYRQLNDTNFYQKLDHDITLEVADRIQVVIDKMLKKSVIDLDVYNYLNIQDPKACTFYKLPKIHKKGIPARPICSSLGHLTNRISSFIDEHIKTMYHLQNLILEILKISSETS